MGGFFVLVSILCIQWLLRKGNQNNTGVEGAT